MSSNTAFTNALKQLKEKLTRFVDKPARNKAIEHFEQTQQQTTASLAQLRALLSKLSSIMMIYLILAKDKVVLATDKSITLILDFFEPYVDKTEAQLRRIALRKRLGKIWLNIRKRLGPIINSPQAKKLNQYALLIRLDKPIGILLLLWPTLLALWIAAGGWPDTDVLLVFIAGVFLMRSAGCAINDYADRHIDCKVARTKDRPLTSGKISEKEALMVFAVLCVTAFILVLFMNTLTIMMSLVGIALAASYPFMKRHTYLPQVHLGAAFGWAVPMAYVAQTNEVTTVTWLLFIATVLWATAYDTMYAMVDREDDLKIGVKSTAILFESADKLIIGIIQALLILCLIMIGQRAELGGFYFAGVLAASVLAVWQQYLIRHRKPAACFQAFLNNNWFGLVLFVGVFLEYQLGGINS
ncbi:4-hydroxybenzoate octaprenyltransferase [Pseudomonadota bacterium]